MELIGGVERRTIEIVAADPGWAGRFEQERGRIAAALGSVAARIDHIGSTAVPQLAAKPIIDVQVSVSDPDEEAAFAPHLSTAGYLMRVREPGHRMMRSRALDVHVHVCAAGSDWERRHLLLRDWLRRDAADRSRYAEVKNRLAARDWRSMNDYAAAKSDVITDILSRAEAWARRDRWSPDSA